MASLTDLLLNFGRGNSTTQTPTFGAQAGALLGGDADQGSVMSDLSKLLFGGNNADGTQSLGWAMPAVGISQAIMGGINGNRQLGMAEDNFKEGKRQFDLNYGAQRQSTNTQLEDRQRARVASNPQAYESVDSYLEKNRIR